MKKIAIIGDSDGSVSRAVQEAQEKGNLPDVDFVEIRQPLPSRPEPIQSPGYGGPMPRTIPSPYSRPQPSPTKR